MRSIHLLLLSLSTLAGASACKTIECAEGTIERNGVCEPPDLEASPARCGANTTLVGDVCQPDFEPTTCDPTSTDEDRDPVTGVVTCIGKMGGGGGCAAPLACPAPESGRQTICGQIYNFETNAPFAADNATGTPCVTATATGPCSVGIQPVDAVQFAMNPQGTPPLDHGEIYIDDCGRFRITDVAQPSGPFIGLGLDDRDMANTGPMGTTITVGVALPKAADTTSRDVETFVAPVALVGAWQASGGPPLANGIYAMIFRASRTGRDNRAGVTATRNGVPNTANDFYFPSAFVRRNAIDGSAIATGASGTALVSAAALNEAHSGDNATLPAECRWSAHPGIALPGILFVQILRPIDNGGTCPL